MKSYTRILMVVALLVTLLAPLPGRAASQPAPGVRVAVEAAGRGNPWINLRDGVALPAAYDGPGAAVQAMADGQAQPLSLAAADFDEDGVPDLVAGYAGPEGGLLALYRGNVDSLYPRSPEAQARREAGTFTDAAFLTPARVFEAPAAPDFLAAGDFDNDGHWDVVLAARNEATLTLLPGDGQGGLEAARAVTLPGGVTALLAGEVNRRDGLVDLAVGIDGPDGAGVLIFQGPRGALLSAPQAVAAPAAVTGLAIGALDDSPGLDLAAAAGNELLIVPGNNDPEGNSIPLRVERHSLPYTVIGLTVGDFLAEVGTPRQELALLAGDGAIYLLDPLTVAQVGTLEMPRPGPGARIVRARVSSLPADDLLLLDPAARQLHLLLAAPAGDAGEPIPPVVTLATAGAPAAVLPMRLNPDALSDLVLLQAGVDGPVVVETAPTATYVVGTALELANAIVAANNSPGADLITFSTSGINICYRLPPGSVPPIDCSIPPPITDALTIVGGGGGSPRTTLDGTLLDEYSDLPNPGLRVAASDTVVRNLVITHFTGGGLACYDPQGAQNVFIEGNYLGTDGAAALGNGWISSGLYVNATYGSTIGGTTAQARNVISGNKGEGIEHYSSGLESLPNLIEGNYVGLGADGVTSLGNEYSGIRLGTAGNGSFYSSIGGTVAGAGNVVSGNKGHGIEIFEGDVDYGNDVTLIQGNKIGTDAGGNPGPGNWLDGVLIGYNVSDIAIGGTVAGAGNITAGNGNTGVCVLGDEYNSIRGNTIWANGGLGIDLGPLGGSECDGPTANDPNDEDEGPNRLQNWPEILAVVIQGDQVQVTFRVDTRPTFATYPLEIDFYSADSSGAEGQTYLGGVSYQEGEAQTIVTKTFTLEPPVPLAQGAQRAAALALIVSTATDANGNTSEFSQPWYPSQVVVNSTGDGYDSDLGDGVCWTGGYTGSGAKECTLRAAIETANARAGLDAITFAIPSAGVPTIRPQSALPPVQEPVFLDGTSQPGGKVELDGSQAGAGADGLYLGANDSLVQGLVVNRFSGCGIVVAGDGNTLLGNIIGADVSGAVKAANGGSGIYVNNGANNGIGGVGTGNLISGNSEHGIELRYAGATGNRVLGNTVGLDASGANKLGNAKSGIFLDVAAHHNTIGGISSGARNVISGNGQHGIELDGSVGNQILGNYIGPQADGASDLTGNGGNGVFIDDGSDNLIGGAATGAGNFISGNGANGVRIYGDTLAEGNQVEGNQIGGKVGSAYLFGGNHGDGVFIYRARDTRLVGNVVTRNQGWGVKIEHPGATGSQLQGNLVGTDEGSNPLPNERGGVLIDEASDTVVGGATTAARNVVSGNGGAGIKIAGSTARRNTVQGNYIGLTPDGIAALANEGDGVLLILGAMENTVAGNVILGNKGHGVGISVGISYIDYQKNRNQVWGNQIGAPEMGNTGDGIRIENGFGSIIGGNTLARRNVISGNGGNGVYIEFGFNNTVQGNVISGHPSGAYGVQLGLSGGDNEILGNDITDNFNAMDDQGQNVVVGNVIQGGLPSRLCCTDCKSQIAGNRFGYDGGIVVSITGAPAVHKNNLEVFSTGLTKQSSFPDPPPITASAQDNWWGEPDGPSGEGPGSGAPVSLYVDYAPWRTAPVALAAVPGHDTLYGSPNAAVGQARLAYAGGTVSNRLFFQNWTHSTDAITVTLQDTLGWLVPPATFTLTVTDGLGASALVSVSVPAGTPLGTTDLVTVTAVSHANPTLTDTATFQVIAVLVADLAVAKQGPDLAAPAQPFAYAITVTNTGPDPATGVVLTDTLPITLTFLSAGASQGSCGEEDGLVVCRLGTLANGGQATVAVTVVPAARGEVVNVVDVTADEPDPARYNNVAVEYTLVGHRVYLPLVQKHAP
jgi:uncharacterized repeat protein (TIGR01451 family)/CSLREA domain-containing protein